MRFFANLMCGALVLLALSAGAVYAQGKDALPARDYRADFDRADATFNGKGDYAENEVNYAWGDSYELMAYPMMYYATGDSDYLRRMIAHFDRVLKNRDDVRGKKDAYAGKALAGWGSDEYSEKKWHVWIVHTGMITVGPAEFVRIVMHNKRLQKEFGAKAAEYRARIEESIRDAEPYWKNGPGPDEGYYVDPFIGPLPLNQQNALGRVLLNLYEAAGNKDYLDKVTRLAHFFSKRLRRPQPDLYDWAYWPKLDKDGPGSEDISHAAANIEFVAQCVADKVVFTRADAARFAQTWLQKVQRPDGSWADTVGGQGKGNQFKPYAGGLWLDLCPFLSPSLRAAFYGDIAHAFENLQPTDATTLLGFAELRRYETPRSVAGVMR